MNNNVNVAALNAMGGPVGGGIPMMNNGLPGGSRAAPVNDNQQRTTLNTYIYEYFLRNDMYDCARAIIQSGQPINLKPSSPGRRRDANGNPLDNGVSPDGMDTDSKDDIDSKLPDDLPLPNLPRECPESCFLYEWWCLFWDMFNAQRGKSDSRNVHQYASITQQQARFKQESQQQMLRQMRPDAYGQAGMMMQRQQNGLAMGQNEIARKAMQNNRTVTPQMQILQQQQQHQQQQQQQQQQQLAKQMQMQRDGSDMDGSLQRAQSPSSAENAPSPSKRPRIEGVAFNGQQGMTPNGRGQPQAIPGQQGGPGSSNTAAANAQMLIANGMNPNLTAQQFQQNFPGQIQGPGGQAKSLQAYTNNLVQHQTGQMANKGIPTPGGPQNQGSPMMTQGQDGGSIAGYYNAGEMGANGMRAGPGAQQAAGGGNHALQDYQMQLMLLEQQNKKRLMMARQEQDSMTIPRDGPGGGGGVTGPNGQPFQGTSPQGARSGASPNPNDQMKRGTPQMTASVPSPIPDGQSRGSPSAMNFMPNPMDPNVAPHFYKQMNGMEANMVAMPGMRPPSSHPGAFNGQITQQQVMLAQQQQRQQALQQGGVGQVAGWQATPNGAPMMQQHSQGPTPQPMGTPQQRAMPPPSAPTTAATANGRTQPSSPQQNAAPPTPSQANKANPKKEKSKPKRNPKKATTTGATPSTDGPTEAATPPPPTPIIPVHPQSFAKNGQNNGVQVSANGQPPIPVTTPVIAPPQPDPIQNGPFSIDDASLFNISRDFDFANPSMSNGDVLQDFDFDSFLHQDGGDSDGFAFDASAYMEGEVGAD